MRHEGNKFAAGRQVPEGCRVQKIVPDECTDLLDLLVRNRQKVVQNVEFIQDLQGGGVHGIAAEIAKEVTVLFEYSDLNAGAGEQKAEHNASRTTADDAAGGVERRRRHA